MRPKEGYDVSVSTASPTASCSYFRRVSKIHVVPKIPTSMCSPAPHGGGVHPHSSFLLSAVEVLRTSAANGASSRDGKVALRSLIEATSIPTVALMSVGVGTAPMTSAITLFVCDPVS